MYKDAYVQFNWSFLGKRIPPPPPLPCRFCKNFVHMKHHAPVQTVRERYNSRREKILKKLFRFLFTTTDVPFTRALNRGVMLHIWTGSAPFFLFTYSGMWSGINTFFGWGEGGHYDLEMTQEIKTISVIARTTTCWRMQFPPKPARECPFVSRKLRQSSWASGSVHLHTYIKTIMVIWTACNLDVGIVGTLL